MNHEEEILAFPTTGGSVVPPVTRVRGTWLASSLRVVRGHGLEAPYLAKLDPACAPAILNAAYTDWLPIEVLLAHYAACEELELPPFQLTTLGTEAARLAQGSVVGMVAKLAGVAPVTPWIVLSQLQRLWDRVLTGGGLRVIKLGPKDARVEIIGLPACRYRYCRIGLRGVLTGMTEMFCTKAHVSELPNWSNDAGKMRIAWV
jgi:hypothetical protein